MKITLLGTSSFPTINRNSQSVLIETGLDTAFIIDCGEGTQRQLLHLGDIAKKVNTIFLTHHHIDHVSGLPGLVIYLYRLSKETIKIVAPRKTLEVCKLLMAALAEEPINPSVQYIEAYESYVGSIGPVKVRCFNTYHTDESLGYSFHNAYSKVTVCGDLTIQDEEQRENIKLALSGSDKIIIDIVHMPCDEALSLLEYLKDSDKALLPVPFGKNALLEESLKVKGTKILNDFDTL